MVENIFKHNSRSYYDIYNAFVAAYPRKPTWLFEEFSGLFDFSSELMNRIATDILYPKTRESAYGFASRCDYEPIEADGATDTITLTLTDAMAKTLAIGYRVGGISLTTGQLVIYELTAVGNSNGTSTIVVTAKQTQSVTNKFIAAINNQDDFATYPIDGYSKIIKGSITLSDGTPWTRVDNFDASGPSDKHFKLIYQSQGRCRIQFGNGVTGLKPTLNAQFYASFQTTLGLVGRMNAGEINVNVDNDPDISSITNAGSSGGNDAESVASILRNARANARLRDIVWSAEDLELTARMASSSIQKAYGEPGIGLANIYIVPAGGGNPDAGLKSIVEAYVISKTQFGALPVNALDPNYVDGDITASTTVRTGFVPATVKNLLRFALTLITSSFDNQIIEYYDDNGIDLCRTAVINVIWSWAFTEDENEALAFIIDQWKSQLGARAYREWGQDLEVGDIWSIANSLGPYGVDEFVLVSPLTNVPTDDDEIIQTGTITVS